MEKIPPNNLLMTSHSRAISIIQRVCGDLELNLTGKIVLTEAGSNNYVYTPLIPLMAGAKLVYVWIRDSRYGRAESIAGELLKIVRATGFEEKICVRENSFISRDISSADIITNSGNLRPIDKQFLSHTKTGVVVPLMYEAWELRENDIDVKHCSTLGIKVAGTWESHPLINVFDYIGILAAKLVLNAGFEILGNRILIWSDDHFGEVAEAAFKKLGAKSVISTTNLDELYRALPDTEVVYICDYSEATEIIGPAGLFEVDKINLLNPSVCFVHLYGEVNENFAFENKVNIYPAKGGARHIMSETLSYVGLEPLLRLQVAGFKVAEELLTGKASNLSQPINF